MTDLFTSRPMTAQIGRMSHQRCPSGAQSASSIPRRTMRTPLTSQSTGIGSTTSSHTFSKRQIWERAGARLPTESPMAHTSTRARRSRSERDCSTPGTELGVYFSFDDGAHWQPLQLNLPQSPIHDLVVKDDDLVVATHGRSFWVLDDLTPLRQLSAQSPSSDMMLYQPQTAVRLALSGGNRQTAACRRQPAGGRDD